MLRRFFADRSLGDVPGFRPRGHEISRVEGFSDAVFAFAVTLLVVSLEVPKTYGELAETMRGFGAFAISFAMLTLVWYFHYQFFRRYGLQDTLTVLLNAVLLFVALFYVYPLKFLFSLLINQAFGGDTMVRLADGTLAPMIEREQTPTLMVIFGAGYVAVFLVFALLHLHAYRKRAELELSELEISYTEESIQAHFLNAGVGLLSILIAVAGGPGYVALAGYTYMLIGVLRTIHGTIIGRRRRKLWGQPLQPVT